MLPNVNSGLFRSGLSFLKSVDFAGLLDGASKTLNLVNQAIPIYYQVKPIVENFHVIKNISSIMNEDDKDKEENNTSPIFYL